MTFRLLSPPACLALLVAFGATLFSFAVITRPIERITRAMGTLAKGDVSTEIPFRQNTNEIGSMAGAVQVFKDSMIRARELESDASASSARAEGERKRAMSQMAEQLGAARVITDPADAGAAAREVLGDPAFRQAAQAVQEQNQALPSPAEVLRNLVALSQARLQQG